MKSRISIASETTISNVESHRRARKHAAIHSESGVNTMLTEGLTGIDCSDNNIMLFMKEKKNIVGKFTFTFNKTYLMLKLHDVLTECVSLALRMPVNQHTA